MDELDTSHTIYIDPVEHIPEIVRPTHDCPWSVALNILASFKLADEHRGRVALYIDYRDERGEHSAIVDGFTAEDETQLLFANLVQLPLRGDLKDACIRLTGIEQSKLVENDMLTIQFEASRSFVDNRPIIHNAESAAS